MTDGLKWGEVFRMYSGAEETFQKLYNGEEVVGSVLGYDYDGDCGYLAWRQDKTTIGKYKRCEDAQKAVEKNMQRKFSKPIDIGIYMWYIIVKLRQGANERSTK